MPTLRLDIKI